MLREHGERDGVPLGIGGVERPGEREERADVGVAGEIHGAQAGGAYRPGTCIISAVSRRVSSHIALVSAIAHPS